MNKFKKLIASTVLSALCITAVIAPTTASASEVTSNLTVNIDATIIDVTITPSVAIPVNPNNTMSSSIPINIKNNTTAPVKVTLASVTAAEGSEFNVVAPDKYTNWSILNKTESTDIALLLKATSGWKSTSNTDYRTGTSDSFAGAINPNATASIMIDKVYHGTAFDSIKTATVDMSFVVELE